MYDTVSDGAVTHFSQTMVQGCRVCKETLKGPSSPKCQQTTVKARTIDGVTETTIYTRGPTDAELPTQLKVPSTSLVMQAARLRYLPRLLRRAPPSLRSLLRLPSASRWTQTMVTDLSDMSKVLSSKLGMLPDPTLDTAPLCDMAHQFPGPWRSLVKLYMSKRAEDASVRRELIDGEDTEYRCHERSRAFTTYGGLTAPGTSAWQG